MRTEQAAAYWILRLSRMVVSNGECAFGAPYGLQH